MTADVVDSMLGSVDQVGSLLRPEPLRDARRRRYRRELTEAQLALIEDEAIRSVIGDQERHGLPVVTDGEFRRVVFMDSFAEIEGFPWRAFSEEFFNLQGRSHARQPGRPAQAT